LDWRGARKTGNLGKGFDAGIVVFAGIVYGIIPDGAAHDGEGAIFIGDTLHNVFDKDAMIAFIMTDGISATADDESGEIARFGEIVSGDDVGFVFNFE